MWKSLTILCCAGVLLLASAAADEQSPKSAEQILQAYVADFRHDPAAAEPITFGVRVTAGNGRPTSRWGPASPRPQPN